MDRENYPINTVNNEGMFTDPDGPQTEGEKPSKHTELNRAFADLSSVQGHLDSLVAKIKGEPRKISEDIRADKNRLLKELENIPLIKTLEEMPKALRNKIVELHAKIDELENLLF